MTRVMIVAVATAALAFVATPAGAATFYQCGVNAPPGSSCISDTSNVNLNTATNVGYTGQTPGTAYIVPNGPTIQFTSTTDSLNLDASGQATIKAMSGALNNLTFTILGGSTITTAEFNLIDIGNANFDVTLYTLLNGVVTATSTTFDATFNGNNRFGVVADAGTITGITINSTAGFGSLTQLRLAAANANAVPEPATWAMMLVGFGGIGLAMRRRRNPVLAQIA